MEVTKKYSGVIGITGKMGSGKSYLGKILAQAVGIEYINFDDILAEVLRLPLIKQYVERRVKNKVTNIDGQIIETFRNLDSEVKDIEKTILLKILANQKLKKILKDGKPRIIDFAALPLLPAAEHFDENILVQGKEKLRVFKRTQRDNMSEDEVNRIDSMLGGLTDHSALIESGFFTQIWQNDFENVPKELYALAARLKGASNEK